MNLEIEGELHLKPETGTSAAAQSPKTGGGELFIVDNSDELWKGLKYLHDWTEIASAFAGSVQPGGEFFAGIARSKEVRRKREKFAEAPV